MKQEEDYQFSKPRHISLNRSLSSNREPIEDKFIPATERQINYIEQLRKDLGYSNNTCSVQISSIIGHSMDTRMWDLALSRSEASQVIEKFKLWKEERTGK